MDLQQPIAGPRVAELAYSLGLMAGGSIDGNQMLAGELTGIDSGGDIACACEGELFMSAIDPGDGYGGSAGATQRQMTAFEQSLRGQVRILTKDPNSLRGSQVSFQAMAQTVGNQYGELIAHLNACPRVARRFLARLRNIHGANSEAPRWEDGGCAPLHQRARMPVPLPGSE